MRRIIFLLVLYSSLSCSPPLLSDTLHAVIVADIGNWNGGTSFKTDLDRMRKLITEITQHTGLTLNFADISGDELTNEEIKSVVTGLSVKLDHDVVLFHYAGHGARTTGKWSLWPLIDVKGGALNFDWVKSTLEQKKPRFLIILADTCNHVNDSLSPVWARSAPDDVQPSSVGYRQLFLNYRGYVFATATAPGEKARGNEQYGGFFRDAFEKPLQQHLSQIGTPS